MASILARIGARLKQWGEEGSWRGPFFGRGELTGMMYELGSSEDGYQRNLQVSPSEARLIPMVYAAVMANAKAGSTCWAKHMRETTPGSKDYEQIATSPAFRIFRDANPYETWPVFLLNMLASLGFDGQAYALAVRDERGAIMQLHRMPRGSMSPLISPVDGSVFYGCGGNPFLPQLQGIDYIVPARDVWHLRQHCPRHPLLGESACNAAAMAMGINVALSRSQVVFFARMSRPSGVLVSDQQLNLDQMTRLRANWDAQSKMLAQGGVPILGNGVKWQPMTITSEDSQLNEAARLSGEDIARVYGVPLPVVGDLTHSTLTNVEQLVSLWLSTGLTSLLELVERDLNKLFNFDGFGEFVELDPQALLRTEFAARVEALCKGIQGALFKPDEARKIMDLPPVPHGNKVYAQAQMQELGTKLESATAPGGGNGDNPPPPNGPDDKPVPPNGGDENAPPEAEPKPGEEARLWAEWAIQRAMQRAQAEERP